MDRENPYAPPAEQEDPLAPAAAGASAGLTFSDQGWDVVTGMAKWMRFVSTVQYVGAGLFGLGSLVLLAGLFSASSRERVYLLGGLVALIVIITLMILGATWLRRAANNLAFGVMDNTTSSLATGFRNLRLYLILYGLVSLFGLVIQVVMLFGLGAARSAGAGW